VFDLRPVMLRHGLHDHFTEYILSFEIGAEKPSATVFDTACAKLGAKPHECLMVGDSAWADGGAAETGVPTLILPRDHDATADRLRVLSLLLSGKG
jgi:HAD superfamily hydrolase (TIGR01509 family)